MTRLVAISPGFSAFDAADAWVRTLGQAGLDGIILRVPVLPEEALLAVAQTAKALMPLVAVHVRHPAAHAVASALGLPVHLRDGDPPIPGPFAQSTHDRAGAMRALDAGAQYVTLSPVWPPTSKPEDERIPLGLERFMAAAMGRPVLALGGITPERFRLLVDGGAYGAAVLGGLDHPPSAAEAALRTYLAVTT